MSQNLKKTALDELTERLRKEGVEEAILKSLALIAMLPNDDKDFRTTVLHGKKGTENPVEAEKWLKDFAKSGYLRIPLFKTPQSAEKRGETGTWADGGITDGQTGKKTIIQVPGNASGNAVPRTGGQNMSNAGHSSSSDKSQLRPGDKIRNVKAPSPIQESKAEESAVDAGSSQPVAKKPEEQMKKTLMDRNQELKEKEDENKELEKKVKELEESKTTMKKELGDKVQNKEKEIKELDEKIKELKKENEKKQNDIFKMEENMNTAVTNEVKLRQENTELNQMYEEREQGLKRQLEDAKAHANEQLMNVGKLRKQLKQEESKFQDMCKTYETKVRSLEEELKKMKTEKDDIRDRFSKMAGQKLTENNADIADLSDPNRAMKLSEKFSGLYDDEWTDAFTDLTNKKKGGMEPADAIELLLSILKKCFELCKTIADSQIQSLTSVLLYPVNQDASQPVAGNMDRPRVSSKEMVKLRELRKLVCTSVGTNIKQRFMSEMTKEKRKGLDFAKLYMEKCAEICWLMAIHDPVLYMDFTLKAGDKLDLQKYTPYSSSGTLVAYLVWPPLHNGEGGGLLSKGVAGTQKVVKK